MATRRVRACSTIGPWSNAIGGSALTGCQRVSGGSSGVAGEGTRPRNVDAMVRAPGTRSRVGEHSELLEVSKFTQVDLLGELAAN